MAAIESATPSLHAHPDRRPALHEGEWRCTEARDGTAIAWRVDGPRRGTPVVLCNGIACSTDYWAGVAARLRRTRQVVQWDYRGHGRSGPPARPSATGVDDIVGDLAPVLDAAGVHRAVLVGHSFGVQVALESARRWPDAVAGVVAIAGAAAAAPLRRVARRRRMDPLELVRSLHDRRPEQVDRAWRRWWRSPTTHLIARAIGGTSAAAPRSVMTSYYEHVSSRDLGTLLAMLRSVQNHDASDVIPALDVPVLALAGDADLLTPLPSMTRLALAAHDGELAVYHGGTHTLPAEQPSWVAARIERLLAAIDRGERTPAARSSEVPRPQPRAGKIGRPDTSSRDVTLRGAS